MPRLREFAWARWSAKAFDTFNADLPGLVAFDTETTGLGFYDEPFGRKEVTAMAIIFAGVLIVKLRTTLVPGLSRLLRRPRSSAA